MTVFARKSRKTDPPAESPNESASLLLDKADFLSLIIEAANEAIISVDEAQRVIIFNPAAEKMFGVTAASAIGTSLERFIPQRYRGSHHEHVKSFGNSGQTKRKMGEFSGVNGLRADGSEFPIEASISKFESRGTKHYTVMLRDATESVEAVERASRLAAIVQTTSDAIIGETLTGIITTWNPGAERLFGYSAREAVGRSLGMLYPTGSKKTEKDILDRIAKGEDIPAFEAVRVRKDGKEIDVSVKLSAIRDAHGIAVGASKIARDITESKNAQEGLRQQAALLDLAPVLVRDLDGTILYWSRGAELMYGFKKRDAIGKISHELLQTEFPIPVAEIDKALRAHGVWEGELINHAQDGKRIVAASQSVVYRDALRKTIRILEANADISALKRAESLTVRSQKLEALGTLAGGIAHDFNNILSAINGNTSLAISELPHEHPVQEFLGEISRAGARAASLVKRILAFSRPLEQKREIRPMQPVVEEALRLVRATLPASIEIRTSFGTDLPSANVDATQIHQVIVNLATNAAHAIGERPGKIEVRLDAVTVNGDDLASNSELQAGRYIRLYVGDTGCGMDAQTLARIFDPFFTTKPTGQGTGLGLSVVHGILTSHGGAVTVYSEPGKGTAFHLYFPAIQAVSEQTAAFRDEVPRGKGEHILYVDDEESLVLLAKRRLERLGYTVSGFSDPQLALLEFRKRSADFDVVITDLAMPQMTGFDFAGELQRIRSRVPILVTSGFVRPEDQARAESMGITEMLMKPAPVEELARALARLTGEKAGVGTKSVER